MVDLNNIKTLYSEEMIQQRITELAKQIDNDYNGKTITIICVLKGAIFFTVDLMKKLKSNTELEIIQTSSYVGTETTGNIVIKKAIEKEIVGKDVLVIEDIIDTGGTLNCLMEYLREMKPNSLKLAVLLDKKERREVNVNTDYVGFEIPNKFVIGYGMDYNEIGRNLPYIGYIDEN